MRVAAAGLLLIGCTGAELDTEPPQAVCTPARDDALAPTDAEAMAAVLQTVQSELFPQLAGVSVALVPLESETDFFQANLDLSTVSDPPTERAYRVLANPRLYDTPPTQPAVVAILAHELAHIVDYTEMTGEELVRFGIWYQTSDTAEYERETDVAALQLGCADGLIAYREWLYTQIPADAVEEKRRTYYTPEEIRAWQAAQGR